MVDATVTATMILNDDRNMNKQQLDYSARSVFDTTLKTSSVSLSAFADCYINVVTDDGLLDRVHTKPNEE